MGIALFLGRMKKVHLLSYGSGGAHCSEKQCFFFGCLCPSSFIFISCHFSLVLNKRKYHVQLKLCYFSWHILYYLKSFCQVTLYLPSLSPEPFHLSVPSAPQIFLLLFLGSFRLLWPHLWSASQVFLVSINLDKLMSSAYFLFSSPPPALPIRTPVAMCCLCHIASELLLYTLSGNFYPWLNFTHMPVQLSEEHF